LLRQHEQTGERTIRQQENSDMTAITTAPVNRSSSELPHRSRRGHHASAARKVSIILLALGLGLTLTACAARVTVPVDPKVDFAAHVEHRGLVVDRAQGGEPAVLVPVRTLPFSSGPTYLLQAQAKTIAALWVNDPAHATVRQTSDPAAPVIGRVEAHWKAGAINLTLRPMHGPELHTGVFERTDGPSLPSVLSWNANTVLDVRGMYEADVLPPSVPESLATAAVALVDSDVDYIEDHAVNVYLGN
jgi:hypothetical protein